MYFIRQFQTIFIMNYASSSRCFGRLIILILLTSLVLSEATDEMTEEQIEEAKKALMARAKEMLFDMRGIPGRELPKDPNAKLVVPRAMLEQYMETREEVREFVPYDRDFYGRINIDASNPQHSMWEASEGGYDIEVNMPPTDESPNSEDFRTKKAKHIGHLPLAEDPEDIPAKLESILPPHTHTPGSKFISVHLKYNLNQEIYSTPTAAADLKFAQLVLSREKVNPCLLKRCQNKSITFFKPKDQYQDTDETNGNDDELDGLNRRQKIFVLAVHGYDKINEPLTRIVAHKTIDIMGTDPLKFDITSVVRGWLEDPKSNYGIIVRVTNFSNPKANKDSQRQTNKRDTDSSLTNASNLEPVASSSSTLDVIEHVRLRRAFQNSSDSSEVWREKQPSLIIWSDPEPIDSLRSNRDKRHHKEEDMKMDEPSTTTTAYQIQTQASKDSSQEYTTQAQQTDKSTHATSGSNGKREHVPTASSSGSRRASPAARSSGNRRPSSQSNGRPKGKNRPSVRQTDKCSLRPMPINFDEVGWSNWIIAPHSFYYNYCAGDCNWPLSDTQNATNHAIIQSIYHSVGRVVPKSCCAPVKHGRMAILYQLDGIVQMRSYDDLIVEACGCL